MDSFNERIEIKEELVKEIGKKNYIDFDENKVITRSKTIGENLKNLRKKIGITQKEISEKIGIAQQTYAGYEAGKHEPSIEIIIRLADIYQISLDYITGRYLGTNFDKALDEHLENEEILERITEHYIMQKIEDDEFMKMVKMQIKNNKKSR